MTGYGVVGLASLPCISFLTRGSRDKSASGLTQVVEQNMPLKL